MCSGGRTGGGRRRGGVHGEPPIGQAPVVFAPARPAFFAKEGVARGQRAPAKRTPVAIWLAPPPAVVLSQERKFPPPSFKQTIQDFSHTRERVSIHLT